ncbi:DUF6221 family protein [Streptomyces canus]|uniref:DUF6221 family protein n=1 Tax=Streptomyces canus TaxID=58343 RepID=UPI0033A75CEA
MPDLHGWITEQIDETERLATRAAALCGCHPAAPSWSFRDGDEPGDGRIRIVDDPHPEVKRRLSRSRMSVTYEGLFAAEHIVRHDPAAVLRRCAADRKILEVHAPAGSDWEPYGCNGCGIDSEYGYEVRHTNDCETLQALAEGYGLTEEQRAALDRPQPEPPKRTGPSLIADEFAKTLYGPLFATYLGTQPVEPRPEVKALEILAPELKKIPGYVPVAKDEP